MANLDSTPEDTPTSQDEIKPYDWLEDDTPLPPETEHTIEETTHGRDLNPPCIHAVTEDRDAEFEEFKKQVAGAPRWAGVSGRELRQLFWNTRPDLE